jgi:AcrR family transcriptional regulator
MAPDDDAGPQSRIRDAALAGFAERGVAATTVRRVAADAAVSPGLVQHYFPSKRALRDAVDRHALALARGAFEHVTPSEESSDLIDEFGRRIAAFVRDHPDVVRHVARSALEDRAPASGLFDAFVGVARGGWDDLAAQDQLRDGVDLEWSALHTVLLNLGTVLFEPSADRHLSEPLMTPEGLDRWRVATTDLFRHGVYRGED